MTFEDGTGNVSRIEVQVVTDVEYERTEHGDASLTSGGYRGKYLSETRIIKRTAVRKSQGKATGKKRREGFRVVEDSQIIKHCDQY